MDLDCENMKGSFLLVVCVLFSYCRLLVLGEVL